jgi:hypothetical protein
VNVTTTATSISSFLDAVRGDHGSTPWAEDATLDAVVPGWRFSLRGADRLDAQFRTWFAHPGELEEVRRFRTDAGEVVEFTVAWIEDGVPFAARQVHVLDIDGDGRITRDNMWCGGRWPAELLAKMEAAGNAG